ncbi:MAG: dihydropteroate synthase [Bacteroidota bacterium]|jgi:dihydropteroate synthase
MKEAWKDVLINTKLSLNVSGKAMLMEQPLVMGILNVTPDSFSDGGNYLSVEAAVEHASQMLADGADIIDIGGCSSRPNAEEISTETELERVIPVIKALKAENPHVVISIDTYRAEVAKQAVLAGAGIINDISAGDIDTDMFETVADLQVPYILTHIKGTPKNMQEQTDYQQFELEVTDKLAKKIHQLKNLGVKDIIIDPGFGFAKNLDQNFVLLRNLPLLQIFELPILVGVSRKSMIYKYLDITPAESLNGSSALHMLALQNGANILRVHDVKEASEVVALFNKYKQTEL